MSLQLKSFVVCNYCGVQNPVSVPSCLSCGAPYKHAFEEGFEVPEVSSLEGALVLKATEEVAQEWTVQGYDASAWNGDQDGSKTRMLAQFGFLRGGYGNNKYDPKYPIYRDVCDRYGIKRGLYWYCWAGYDWREHARSISALWKQSPGQLDVCIDAEDTIVDLPTTAAWMYNLTQELQALIGSNLLIYTNRYWWNSHVGRTTWAHKIPLFAAHWTSLPLAEPLIPDDWMVNTTSIERWLYWQHSADDNGLAAVYGFTNGDPDVDRIRFNGSIDSFNQRYGTDIQPLGVVNPPLEDPYLITPIKRVKITAGALNTRGGPSTAYTDHGEVILGSVLPVIEQAGDWLKVAAWIHGGYTKDV